MIFSAILTDLYGRLRYASTPATAVTTRLKAFVNETHRELLALPGLERLRDDVLPVTALANQARCGLPPSVDRIHGIVDRTNNRKLEQVPLATLRIDDPGQLATGGPPIRYAVLGYRQVQLQPATTGLWAVSSLGADSTQKVFCETLTTGGFRSVTATTGTTLTGTTRVALGARTDHLEVDKFYLDAVATGYVSLYDAALVGNELARIAPGETAAKYLTVEWNPIPTADTPEFADVSRAIFDLVNPGDEPLLPVDFHYVLNLGARKREYEFTDDQIRWSLTRIEYDKGVAALRSFVLDDGDRLASLRSMGARWSRLGPTYPPNR